MSQQSAQAAGPASFFVSRWRRQVPLGLMVWRDMVGIGTLINVACAFGGLMALGFKAELWVAMLIIHAPLPYNIFIVASIWRAADLTDPATASTARFGAALWLLAAMFV